MQYGIETDTIMFEKIITSNKSLSLAESIEIEYPKSTNNNSISIIINNKIEGVYSFDNLKNNSELLVNFHRDFIIRDKQLQKQLNIPDYNHGYVTKWKYEFLKFNLSQKGKFKFH